MFFRNLSKEKLKSTSAQRYQERILKFSKRVTKYPQLEHWWLWVIHNCVAHPILGFFPGYRTVEFHDLTSSWLNRVYFDEVASQTPKIPKRFMWIFHNVVVHMLIGLFPCGLTFKLHDWSAEKMDVEDWV